MRWSGAWRSMTCEDRARKLDLFTLQKASGDPLAALQYLHWCHQEDLAKLSTVVHGWRTRDNRHKLKQERFSLGRRRSFFPHGTVKQWIRLPKEFGESPALEVFKTGLDKTLENLVWSHSWPCFEWEVGLEAYWGPFQLELSYDLIKTSYMCTHSPRRASRWQNKWNGNKTSLTWKYVSMCKTGS